MTERFRPCREKINCFWADLPPFAACAVESGKPYYFFKSQPCSKQQKVPVCSFVAHVNPDSCHED